MAPDPGAAPVRVLIAEDDHNILISLEFLFKNAGYEVTIARDGEQALAAARSWRPHLVVLDIMLPLLNGFEVCRALRESAQLEHLKILMLTARGREGELEKGIALGANAYVTKPFATRELMRIVGGLLA
jgi:two-component system, OmpR family, alkaline phosphatase synthesis response regulator PhoP